MLRLRPALGLGQVRVRLVRVRVLVRVSAYFRVRGRLRVSLR